MHFESLGDIMHKKIEELECCPECGSPDVLVNEHKQYILCKGCGGIFSELTPDQMRKYETLTSL